MIGDDVDRAGWRLTAIVFGLCTMMLVVLIVAALRAPARPTWEYRVDRDAPQCWEPANTADVVCGPVSWKPADAPPVNVDPPRCEEDEPCWDCTTMGNRICGSQ